MTIWCIFCGKYFTPSEYESLSKLNGLTRVHSLKQKLFQRTDRVLRSYVIHNVEAESLLAKGDGFQAGTRLNPSSRRGVVPTKYGVLNSKIYVDDLPHCPCGGQMLNDSQINRLMGIHPAQRSAIDPKMRNKVLECWNHRCARCDSKADLEIHHIRPVVHGGTNELDNLVPLWALDFHRVSP